MTVDGVPNVRVCTMPATAGAVVRRRTRGLRWSWTLSCARPDGPADARWLLLQVLDQAQVPLASRRTGDSKGCRAGRGKRRRGPGHRLRAREHVRGGCSGGWRGRPVVRPLWPRQSPGLGEWLSSTDQQSLGGHLRDLAGPVTDGRRVQPAYRAMRWLPELAGQLSGASNVTGPDGSERDRGCTRATCLRFTGETELIKLRADHVIVATGTQETPLPFRNNDVPGVMLGTAALRLANRYGVKPGNRGIVVADGPHGLRAARELLDAGVPIAAFVDTRAGTVAYVDTRASASLDQEAADLTDMGVRLMPSHAVVNVRGGKSVKSVTLRRRSGERAGEEVRVECDFRRALHGRRRATGAAHAGWH